MQNLSGVEKKALLDVAGRLNLEPLKLWALVQFESKWNPRAANPYSSAKGLIQFTNATAKWLGYASSLDLIKENPDRVSQLYNAVLPYLNKYKPFVTDQALVMSVFYPKAKYWPELQQFPQYVQKVNPGIKTPLDYLRKFYNVLNYRYVPRMLILGVAGILVYAMWRNKE